ncbi:MAG: hypothetical protein AB1405_00955 [Bdellovibrionota bacterium]
MSGMRTAGKNRKAALGIAVLALFAWSACTEPTLPPPIPKDPMIGALATLGDVPLFAARETQTSPEDFFDLNGVRAPHVLEGPGGLNEFLLYYEGVDDTTNVSAGIGEARSTNQGFSFGDRRLLLVRRNRFGGDLGSLGKPTPPPNEDSSFDSRGVQHPMVLEDCPFTTPAGGQCLFYSGPGETSFDGDREYPVIPSGISMVAVPPLGSVARNAVPVLLANKDMENYASLPPEDDVFYTERPPSFDATVEPCDRRSFLAGEFQPDPSILNDDSGGLGIQAGPYPWESGGVSAPFVIENPRSPGQYLMYYTCTEEFGELDAGCQESFINRICVAELFELGGAGGQLVARRIIRQPVPGDNNYATPSNPNEPLPNNIVIAGNNFPGFDEFGASDPSVLISRSVLGTVLYRMWYTGTNQNGARSLGITGAFDGFDWDTDDPELRVSTTIPGNPILVQAQKSAAPAAFFASDRILRVYYESTTSGTEGAINLATIVDLDDRVAPTIDFASPAGAGLTVDQGCDVDFELQFEDSGGSGIDQSSFVIQFTDISRTDSAAASTVEGQNDITTEAVSIAEDVDWAEEFPTFSFGSGDSAEVFLRINQFRLNPPLSSGSATATLDLNVRIFDRVDNESTKSITLTLVESGLPTVCD